MQCNGRVYVYCGKKTENIFVFFSASLCCAVVAEERRYNNYVSRISVHCKRCPVGRPPRVQIRLYCQQPGARGSRSGPGSTRGDGRRTRYGRTRSTQVRWAADRRLLRCEIYWKPFHRLFTDKMRNAWNAMHVCFEDSLKSRGVNWVHFAFQV